MKIYMPEDMPAPDALVQYADGIIMPAMFHYVEDEVDLTPTAKANGFDMKIIAMEDNAPDLFEEYSERGLTLADFKDWRPAAPEGYAFGGCWDTENGPVCCFLKRLEE